MSRLFLSLWNGRRKGVRHIAAISAGCCALIAVPLILFFSPLSGTPVTSQQSASDLYQVGAPRPVVQRLSLVGTIEPGNLLNLVAPFDGAVQEKLVEYGEKVRKGQPMLRLDVADIDLLVRDAEAVFIKAKKARDEMASWDASAEVLRARHSILAAQAQLDAAANKEKELEALLSKGIIPRMEYESGHDQRRSYELQLTSAKRELDALLQKADSQARKLTALEMETANKRLEELKRQMEGSLIKAPISGLAIRPISTSSGNQQASVEAGGRVSKGQVIFSIANTDVLSVHALVDEIDVNKISEGQDVDITGDAFGGIRLTGNVARISPQAVADARDGASSHGAVFDVLVGIPILTDEQRSHIRVGMSANLTVVTERSPSTIVIPMDAVHRGVNGAVVVVRDPASGRNREVPVATGGSTEDGIQIVEGLKEGDLLVLESRQPASMSPDLRRGEGGMMPNPIGRNP